MSRARQTAIVPLGEGVVARRLRIADENIVLLGGVIHGHDHLAWIHGDGPGTVVLVTTSDRARELDAVLDGVRAWIGFEQIPPASESNSV